MADSLEEKRKKVKQHMVQQHMTEQSIQQTDVDIKPEVSQGESLQRGAEQGASMGFFDELSGAVSGAGRVAGFEDLGGALKDVSYSSPTMDWDEIVKAYQKTRDDQRVKTKLAEEANPKTYLGGNILGGLPALSASGVAGAASLGGAAGLGSSDVDLTKEGLTTESLTEVGKDVAMGAGLGAGVAAIPAIGKEIVSSVAKSTPGKAFMRGVAGEVIDPTTFGKETGEQIVNYSKDTLKRLQDLEEAGAKVKAERLKASTTPLDVSKARESIESGINELAPSGTNVASLKDLQRNALEDVSGAFGDETIETLKTVQTTGTKVKNYPRTPSARQQLEEEIAKEKVTADALGQSIRHEIKETVGPDGKKYLTKITSSDEPIEAAERAIPLKDAEGNFTGDFSVNKPDTQYKTTAKAKTVEDIPETGGYKTFTPDITEETQTILNKVRNNQPITAQEAQQLNTVLEALKGKADYKDIKPITSALSRGQSEITQEINKIPEIGSINRDIQNINATRNTIGAGSDFGDKAINFGMQDPRQYKLSDAIYKAATERGSGAKTTDQLKQMVNKLREVDPIMADKIERELPKMIESAEIASAINPSPNYSRAGILKQALTKGANPLGRYLGRPLKAIADTADTLTLGASRSIPTAFSGAGVTSATRGGFQESDIDKTDTSALTQKMSSMSPDELMQVAERLRSTPSLEGVASKVEKAAQSGKQIDKAQAQFVIQQNPTAKALLENK